MNLIVNDLRRSGYWGRAILGADSRLNPFMSDDTNIQIPTGSCILYTYDANENGAVDENEYFGFKLLDNQIMIRQGGSTTNDADCDHEDDRWEGFTDGDQVSILSLQFSFTPITGLSGTSRCLNITTNESSDTNATACTGAASGANIGEKRIVNIRMTGTLSADPDYTTTLLESVLLKNNRLYTQP